MIDTKKIAIEFFKILRIDTLKTYAKSHGIKIGRNKLATIENIMERCDKWEMSISAIPEKDFEITIRFTPSTETKTTCACGANPVCEC